MAVGFVDILKELRYIEKISNNFRSLEEMQKWLKERGVLWERRIGLKVCLFEIHKGMKIADIERNQKKYEEWAHMLPQCRMQIDELEGMLYNGFEFHFDEKKEVKGGGI